MVNVALVEVRMDGSGCEVEQMIDDENAYNGPSPSHRARGEVRAPCPPSFVGYRPAPLADSGKLKSSDDVKEDCDEKYCAGGPQQTRVRFEKGGVRVNFRSTLEYQQVACNVADEVTHADRPGYGHHDLFSDCGSPKRE